MRRTRGFCGLAVWLGLAGAVPLSLGCGADAPGREADAPEATREVRASQRVRVTEIVSGRLGGLAEVAGITSAFRTATVAAEVGARVVARHVEPGQRVAAGEPLVSLDESHLAIAVDEARATLAAREVDLAQARRELERGDELVRRGAISDGHHDDLRFASERAASARDLANAALRRARRAREDAVVRSPFAGSVERIEVQVGDYLGPGAPVAQVADFERVRLRAGVTAAEAALLHPGAPASVSIPALGSFEATAAVHSVGQSADPTTGTYPIEIWLKNPDAGIRGGMVAKLRVASDDASAVAIAPRGAILRQQGRPAVYVVEPRGDELRAYLRGVRVGRQHEDRVEILAGVSVGERVVVDGHFALTDGALVFVDAATSPPARQEAAWND